ncbi:3651_t:CDS:2 [Paraglomus occultum]|uniref:3651_t:CDS:1 n=1 Tax=Paraglomus occultum TaxID=144539 RepID=A0A9N9FU05_9GLOM|nr:3651_t:CDS:2 [Paraglomus occultum]
MDKNSTSDPLSEDFGTLISNIYGTVNISPNSFFVRTDKKRRSNTVLGLLGLLGGAWSLAITGYTTLFGSKRLAPLLDNSSTLDVSTSSSDLSFQDNNTLQQRLDALELFLKEYVIDQTYLENLKDNKYSNRLSKFLGKSDLERSEEK